MLRVQCGACKKCATDCLCKQERETAMGGPPKSKNDRRLAPKRSSAYRAGERTKAEGKPTNARDGKSKPRVEEPKTKPK